MHYPPTPTRREEISILLEAYRALIPNRSAIYVSAPITSGRRLADWYKRSNGDLPKRSHPSYWAQHAKQVVEPNLEQAAKVVASLRLKYPERIVIDPTAVSDFPNWTQDDYRYFWGEVIKRYADTVIFVDGWQFSNGCAYEFVVATRVHVTVLNEQGQTLSIETGTELLKDGAIGVGTETESAVFLRSVLADLEPALSTR